MSLQYIHISPPGGPRERQTGYVCVVLTCCVGLQHTKVGDSIIHLQKHAFFGRVPSWMFIKLLIFPKYYLIGDLSHSLKPYMLYDTLMFSVVLLEYHFLKFMVIFFSQQQARAQNDLVRPLNMQCKSAMNARERTEVSLQYLSLKHPTLSHHLTLFLHFIP